MRIETARRVEASGELVEGSGVRTQVVVCSTTFTELDRISQAVVIVHRVVEAPQFGPRFTSTPDPSRVMESVTIVGPGIDDEVLHRVADKLPTLARHAFTEAQSELDHGTRTLGASRVGKEVVKAADVYLAAVKADTSPLRAVMDELHLSKPTASRRIRAAKDAGLLPEKASDLR